MRRVGHIDMRADTEVLSALRRTHLCKFASRRKARRTDRLRQASLEKEDEMIQAL